VIGVHRLEAAGAVNAIKVRAQATKEGLASLRAHAFKIVHQTARFQRELRRGGIQSISNAGQAAAPLPDALAANASFTSSLMARGAGRRLGKFSTPPVDFGNLVGLHGDTDNGSFPGHAASNNPPVKYGIERGSLILMPCLN
jgi:hypothetical protein